MPARQPDTHTTHTTMTALSGSADLHAAAIARDRVRVRGPVIERGDGYSGRYRNAWLKVAVADAHVRVTASPTSTLGTTQPGEQVDLLLTLTGMLDLTDHTYYGERTKLLDVRPV